MDEMLIPAEMAAAFKDGPVLARDCKVVVANAVAHILRAVGEDPRETRGTARYPSPCRPHVRRDPGAATPWTRSPS